jgi:hypothetical protein
MDSNKSPKYMRNPKLLPPLIPSQIWQSSRVHDCQPTHNTNLGEKKEKRKQQAIDSTSSLSLFLSNYFHFYFFPVCRDSGHLHGWPYFIK